MPIKLTTKNPRAARNGRVSIEPGRTDQKAEDLGALQNALDTALAQIGAPTLEAAEQAHVARMQAAQTREGLSAQRAALAPEEEAALRAQIADLPEAPEASNPPPDLERLRAAALAADTAETEAQARLETARTTEAARNTALIQAKAAHSAALSQREQAESALTGPDDANLSEALTQAQATLLALEHKAQAFDTAPLDPETTLANLRRAQSVMQKTKDDITWHKVQIQRCSEQIASGAGAAVDERLRQTEADLAAAQSELQALRFEVQVLDRLVRALKDTRSQAKERYLAPVVAEIDPLLRLIWGAEAQVEWDDKSLLPAGLQRGAMDEPLDALSGGTQEQLAILVRLAFARLHARQGRSLPVLLDDALVYADDARIDAMFNALHRQATDLQILVLTCRERAFRGLGGHSLRFEPV